MAGTRTEFLINTGNGTSSSHYKCRSNLTKGLLPNYGGGFRDGKDNTGLHMITSCLSYDTFKDYGGRLVYLG